MAEVNKNLITNKEFEELLEGIKSLYTTEELENIRTAFAMMTSSDKRQAKQLRQIVPIEEWISNPYFVGPDAESLYPFWKEQLIKIFSSEATINQVILTGAIGIGKTTAATLAIIRKIYELSCYENIAALFNLFGVSRIAFAYLSVTKEQAMNTGFSLLLEWLDSIPYFKENFKRRDKIDSMIIWPQERLLVTFGSVANHFIGMNLFGSILDEANYFSGRSREEADYKLNSKVSELYTQIVARSQSRFVINGINHSFSIVVSSSTVSSSFTNQIIDKSKDDPHTVVLSPSLWEVKPWNYKGDKFLVFAGGDNIDPTIINNIEDLNSLLEVYGKNKIPAGINLKEAYKIIPVDIKSKLVEVPEEHRQVFQTDIIIALQDLAGYSVSAANKLFSSNAAYNKCIAENLQHPFSRNEITLSTTKVVTQEGYMPIKSYLNNDVIFNNIHMPRFMHLDLALTGDSAGISMCHISGWKNIYNLEYVDEEFDDDENYLATQEIKIPIIEIDFMLRINPPKKPNRISLAKIRDFIIFLKNEKGINFGLVTADQFQSAQLMQELNELGIQTGYLSVDRTADAYLTFANLLYEERVKLYDYEQFRKELFNVIYYPAKNKVDHVSSFSKDVADSVVGSAFNAINSVDKSDVQEQALIDLYLAVNSDSTNINDAITTALNNLVNAISNK